MTFITKILGNAGEILDGSITNRIISRAVNGEAHSSEIHYINDAIDHAGDGDGVLEIGDLMEFAGDKVESVCDFAAESAEVLGDIFSSCIDFFG